MITRPTASRLTEVVRHELKQHIAPVVQDPQLAHSLTMIDHVLSTIGVRAEHEIAWMTDDIAAIERLTLRVERESPGVQPVTAALAAFQRGRTGSLRASDVIADFDLASEVLSTILEAGDRVSSEVAEEARSLLRRRVDHGVQVAGDFRLVAR